MDVPLTIPEHSQRLAEQRLIAIAICWASRRTGSTPCEREIGAQGLWIELLYSVDELIRFKPGVFGGAVRLRGPGLIDQISPVPKAFPRPATAVA